MKFDQEKHWAGTAPSYWAVIDAQERALEYYASKDARRGNDMTSWIDDMMGPVMSLEGDVAVISIKGSLVNGEAGIMRLYGVLGYDDIRQALTDAVAEKNAKSILLRIDSGGGSVAGCQELGNYIMEVGKIKPTASHSDTVMASAAYWLGCAANTVSAGSTAVIGSIGVLIVHQEVTKMMADAGITATVIRSGKYKALGNRYEVLSELAKEELQSQVDDLDETFNAFVGSRRGYSTEATRKRMGQGREFLGMRAKEAGLVDEVLTLSEAFKKVETLGDNNAKNPRKPVARAQASANNSTNVHEGQHMKFNLTPEQLAALASGTPVASLGLSEADQAALTAALAAAATPAPAAAAAPAAAPAAAAPAQAATEPSTNVVDFLRTELRDANQTLATTKSQLEVSTTQLTALQASNGSLLKIARDSIGNMQIALGGRNTSATLPDAEVLAEHTRLAAVFTATLPTARVSAAAAVVEDPSKTAAKPDVNLSAAMAAARRQY